MDTSTFLDWVRPCVAEFLGHTIYTFMHCLVASAQINSLVISMIRALGDAFTLGALAMMLGPISGGHVNFAVTSSVFIGGGMKLDKVPLYFVMQCFGSILGASLSYLASGEAAGYFAPGVSVRAEDKGATYPGTRALLVEILATFFLCLVVLRAHVERKSSLAPFAIAYARFSCVLASAYISGGCLNPTLSLGPAILSNQWRDYWVYWIGPEIGALMAGGLFRYMLADRYRVSFVQTISADDFHALHDAAGRYDAHGATPRDNLRLDGVSVVDESRRAAVVEQQRRATSTSSSSKPPRRPTDPHDDDAGSRRQTRYFSVGD